MLAHLDTVHPIGMIEKDLKIRQEGDSVFGPGIYDMKAGGYIAYYALRHLIRQGKKTRLPVTFLFIPEEEVGSPTSRARIEAAARGHKYCLVMEPGRDGDKVVTSRKGVGRFVMTVKGRASHAGVRHEDGRSAILEMAKQILRIEGKTDYARGITCNVGLVKGGTGVNVVSAECTAEIDLRVPSQQLAEEMTHWFLGLEPIGADVEVTVTGGMNRPPYQKDAGIADLFGKAQTIYREIGKELNDVPLTGGGSDGNFTAALGIPDARRAGRRRQGRARRLRADLFFLADAAHLSLRAAAGDAGLMVTIFHVPDSRSLRVLWTLEEMGVKADVKTLPFPPRRLQPDYFSVNPAGTVPAMVDGDRVMTESLAICEVLVARYGNTSLVVAPGDPERAVFLQWLWYGESTIMLPIGVMSRVERLKVPGPATDAILADARETFTVRLAPLERRLEGRDFLVAGRLTLADISVGFALHIATLFGVDAAFGPRTVAYRARLRSRPAFVKAAAVR